MNKIINCLIVLLSFLLLYVFYKDQVVHDGNLRYFYKKYYIILILILLLFLFTKLINEIFKFYILIIFFSILCSLYFFESYITYYPKYKNENIKKKIKKIYYENTGLRWDERTRYEIYKDLKKNNPNVKISIGSNNFVNNKKINILPLAGFPNALTINCNENGYYSKYLSDRYGFNNPDQEWGKNEIEFLLIGDSYTHGSCVNRPHDIASNLRILSNKNVLNLGYHGNGTLVEFATLREYFPKNVKNVIILYFEENDLYELKNELKNPILRKYLSDEKYSQNLKLRQKDINKLLNGKLTKEIYKTEIDEKFTKFLKLFNTRAFFKNIRIENLYQNKEILKNFSLTIDKINQFVLKNGAKLHFVYLPEFKRYSIEDYKSNYLEIKKIINSKNIEFIDLHEKIFKKHNYPMSLFSFSIENHYTKDTYYQIANLLYEKIEND